MEAIATRMRLSARDGSPFSSLFRSSLWEAVMKPAQWMAVLILALMVGGITFVMVYLGSSSRPAEKSPPRSVSLTFTHKTYPQEGDEPPITEVNQEGRHDFWFTNDSGQDVPVGLIRKGCTCTTVELALAPEGWKTQVAEATAGRVLRLASSLSPGGLEGVGALASAYTPELSESEVKTKTLDQTGSVVVPAGAFGRVRLTWLRKSAQVLNTDADLWLSQKDGVAGVHLQVSVRIARPIEVKEEVSVGSFDIRDLETEQKKWVYCWSETRPSFTVKVEPVHGRRAAESDAVEVGQPIALNADDLRRLEQSEKTPGRILSGYRIPLTLRAKAKDNTPIEWGQLFRYINLSSDDEGIEPVQVRVTGAVHGDVTVGGGKDSGVINLGPFSRSRGARGEVVLQTDVQGLELKLDSSRVPEYLKARLGNPEVSPSGHRVWVLEVEVPPDVASGEFPRTDDPIYRDSAIYVTTEEERPRSIRVPVMGTANAS
jgi:hypothetical protein